MREWEIPAIACHECGEFEMLTPPGMPHLGGGFMTHTIRYVAILRLKTQHPCCEEKRVKTILHLCADIGSDSYPYQIDSNYEVIKIGIEIGVENYSPDRAIHGIIANPVCTEFSTAPGFHKKNTPDLSLLNHCQRIIKEASPVWWVIENPFNGTMKKYIGHPDYAYEPWQFGSPWTKKTALWGDFNKPLMPFNKWEQVPKNDKLYVRPGRPKPSLAFLHKSAIHNIPEFEPFIPFVDSDNAFRSLCSQGFANAFKASNP